MFTLLAATVIAPTTHESGQRSSCQLPARFMIREGLVGQAKVGKPAVAAWLRQQHAMGALICSVCTGLHASATPSRPSSSLRQTWLRFPARFWGIVVPRRAAATIFWRARLKPGARFSPTPARSVLAVPESGLAFREHSEVHNRTVFLQDRLMSRFIETKFEIPVALLHKSREGFIS